MKLRSILLSHLVASAQPRPLLTSEVDKLAASIKDLGLIQPITVTNATVIHGTAESGWRIVAGHHRVAACRALGWTEIDALVIEGDSDLQTELIEIDENLCRAELSASQRTKYTKRRKQIWEALHPDPIHDQLAAVGIHVSRLGAPVIKHPDLEVEPLIPPQVSTHGGARPQTKGFAASTAEATGMTKQAINRQLARAESLGDETLDKITGTSLDSGAQMDALVKMEAPERTELIERAATGEQVSARTNSAPANPSKAPARTLPMRLYKAVHDMVHGLGFADVKSLIEAIADLPELSNAEQATLDDALDICMSIGELVPRAVEVA